MTSKGRRQEPNERASLTEDEDVRGSGNEESIDGLTLKQAATIYFGGLAVIIAGLVVVGLST